jgi:hypothetical protein
VAGLAAFIKTKGARMARNIPMLCVEARHNPEARAVLEDWCAEHGLTVEQISDAVLTLRNAPWDVEPSAEPCRHGYRRCPVCHGWGPTGGRGGVGGEIRISGGKRSDE